jgi:hypothetical protein
MGRLGSAYQGAEMRSLLHHSTVIIDGALLAPWAYNAKIHNKKDFGFARKNILYNKIQEINSDSVIGVYYACRPMIHNGSLLRCC